MCSNQCTQGSTSDVRKTLVEKGDKTLMFFNALDDPCENYRCLNGGICLVEDGPYCSCQERFIGRYCDTYNAGKEITLNF